MKNMCIIILIFIGLIEFSYTQNGFLRNQVSCSRQFFPLILLQLKTQRLFRHL